MTREEFDNAVAKMRAFPDARLVLTDFYRAERAPYRYASLNIARSRDHFVHALTEAGRLTVDIGDAHMTMFVHRDGVTIDVITSRDLEDHELRRDVDLTVSFPVEP